MGSASGSSRSGSGSKGGSETQSEETSSAQQVTEAQSSLAKRLLKNGETLVYETEEAPALDGMTYEATWEDTENGICIYLYEEGYAVLEVSSVKQGTGNKTAHAFDGDVQTAESENQAEETEMAESGSRSTQRKPSSDGSSSKTGSSSSNLRFLLVPEQTEDLEPDSLLESWQQNPDNVQAVTASD